MPRRIFLFTLSYPYKIGVEDSFISDELNALVSEFKVILLPHLTDGGKYNYNKEATISIDLSNHLRHIPKPYILIKLILCLKYSLLYKELLSKPALLFSPTKLKRLISYIYKTYYIKNWLDNFIKNNSITQDDIIYTYWFTEISSAIALLKKKYEFLFVTRAHGIDLYEERNNNYIPVRKWTISKLDRYIFVSDYGENYSIGKYPQFKKIHKTLPLGTRKTKQINQLKKTTDFHIVSCSTIDKNKRVVRLYKALKESALANREQQIKWTHFGTGSDEMTLKAMINESPPNNLFIRLKGHVSNDTLFDFYIDESINAFITISASEGGRPVSIQEALSFGIPVIATKVGGIPEIVNEKNGLLLPSNPSDHEIANHLNDVYNNQEEWNLKRAECIKTWEKKCNSAVLVEQTLQELRKV